MLYVTILLVAAVALLVLLILLVRLVTSARRAGVALQDARRALDEGTGEIDASAATLRAELERRRHPRTSGGPDDSTTA